jgi:hypothetical protein
MWQIQMPRRSCGWASQIQDYVNRTQTYMLTATGVHGAVVVGASELRCRGGGMRQGCGQSFNLDHYQSSNPLS